MQRMHFASLHVTFLLLYSLITLFFVEGSSQWKTLNGKPPLVIARGGFSGLFPDSSSRAYDLALTTSVLDVVLWCDVQLTKDGKGICSPDIRLENSTNISILLKNKANTYVINGISTRGWFSVDFNWNELSNVILTQGIYTRSNKLDGNMLPIQTIENVIAFRKPGKGIWLNVQYNTFYTQHNKSMTNYILDLSKRANVDYISSPEVTFLKSIAKQSNSNTAKPVFRFRGPRDIEPSTKRTYSSLLENLPFIKSFASGILVPKAYIWPVDASLYLQPHTSLVLDAHKEGLQVFASDFYNDVPFSFNYSYDPIAEYLNFVDNDNFSVDGVLSDFPVTPSAARECFSHLDKNASNQVNVLVISKNGASGEYPGCTDKAYQKAIVDGADIIDCPIQISKDGIPFCLSSIDLKDSTTIAQSNYSSLAKTIPEIKSESGIFTFSLTWNQISALTPAISNPYENFELPRNPKFKNVGKFLSLSHFLALAKNSNSLSGVLINIENAAYLMEKQQISVIDAVLHVLREAGFENQTTKTIMIQSSNSSILKKFKHKNNYKLIYRVDEKIRDVDNAAIEEIKTFADSVIVNKSSILTSNFLFLSGVTDVVPKLRSQRLDVFVELFSNEFVSQAWDFLSDATVEINTYVQLANVSGIVTEFPLTATRYKKNKCLNLGKETPFYMKPIEPGWIMNVIAPQDLPPIEAPNPILTESDVVEPPLPVDSRRALPPTTTFGTIALAPSPIGTTTLTLSPPAALAPITIASPDGTSMSVASPTSAPTTAAGTTIPATSPVRTSAPAPMPVTITRATTPTASLVGTVTKVKSPVTTLASSLAETPTSALPPVGITIPSPPLARTTTIMPSLIKTNTVAPSLYETMAPILSSTETTKAEAPVTRITSPTRSPTEITPTIPSTPLPPKTIASTPTSFPTKTTAPAPPPTGTIAPTQALITTPGTTMLAPSPMEITSPAPSPAELPQ